MPSFQLVGLAPDHFTPLFDLSDDELALRGAKRVVANAKPNFPCRISLVDAEVGDELLLLTYTHQSGDSPYRAGGPIFVRRGARQSVLPPGEVPDYVMRRLMSARAYDAAHMIVDANVCEGKDTAQVIDRLFSNEAVRYIHLHNAKRGCFSCRVDRV